VSTRRYFLKNCFTSISCGISIVVGLP
jgi:hypothetical protein